MADPVSSQATRSRAKSTASSAEGTPQRWSALAGDVLRDSKAVFRAELDLARTELKQDAKTLIQVVVAATAGIILLHVSLLALATAVVLWLEGSVGALLGVGLILFAAGATALWIANKQR